MSLALRYFRLAWRRLLLLGLERMLIHKLYSKPKNSPQIKNQLKITYDFRETHLWVSTNQSNSGVTFEPLSTGAGAPRRIQFFP